MKTGMLRRLLEEMNSDASDWFQTHAGLLACVYPGHRQSIREVLGGFYFNVAPHHFMRPLQTEEWPREH
jgi:hypothetical protein